MRAPRCLGNVVEADDPNLVRDRFVQLEPRGIQKTQSCPIVCAEQSVHSALSDNVHATIAGALETFGRRDRFDISGPDVEFGPRAALSLAMLVHELVTNALKYGALSVDQGRVSITWEIDSQHELHLRWVENGGPPAVEPTRRGFGTRLIRMGLTGTGGVELDFKVSGLEARMSAPLAQVMDV